MVHRQILQHSHGAGKNPAVAAAPENFRPIRLSLGEERTVAEKEVVVGAVEIIRRAPPVRHREIQVTFVARRRVKARPRRRRHEQRVAPRPKFLAVVALRKVEARRPGRIGEDPVKPLAHRRNHPVFAVEKIQLGADLAVALVVGVIFAALIFRQLPEVCLALGEHRVAVFGIAGNSRQRHHADVADGTNPAGRAFRDRMRELPVSHALHHRENGLRRDIGGIGLRAQLENGE